MRAFIYSLDSFIALLIILFIIQLLLTSVSFMQFREPIAYQVKILSADMTSMLSMLSFSGDLAKDGSICSSLQSILPSKYEFRATSPKSASSTFSCERPGIARLARASSSSVVVLYEKYGIPEIRPPACSVEDLQGLGVVGSGSIIVDKAYVEVGI